MPPLVLGPAWVVWVSVWLQCTATLYTQPKDFSHFIAFQSIEFSVDSGSDGLIFKVSSNWSFVVTMILDFKAASSASEIAQLSKYDFSS